MSDEIIKKPNLYGHNPDKITPEMRKRFAHFSMPKSYKRFNEKNISDYADKDGYYFEGLDFSNTDSNKIKEILESNNSSIIFNQCNFLDLSIPNTKFDNEISFLHCSFIGTINFSKCYFKYASFKDSTFNGETDFSNVTFEFLDFSHIIAKGKVFNFVGNEIPRENAAYAPNELFLSYATFNTEAAFSGREFLGITHFDNVSFKYKFWFTGCNFGCKSTFYPRFDCDNVTDIEMCYHALRVALEQSNYNMQSKVIEKIEQKIFEANSSNLEEEKPQKDLLNTDEVSKILDVKVNTLEGWRSKNTSTLPYIKIGRKVMYKRTDVERYLESQKQSK